jgi:hypothetical protein
MAQMSDSTPRSVDDYPLANTEATRMLAAGLERVHAHRGLTQKDVASKLNYKTSVVLSHMALGRVPIPVDRAEDIAAVLGLDPTRFLLAVLKQRHPDVDFETLLGVQLPQESGVAAELEALAGTTLDELPKETKQVLREVASAANPQQRWLTTAELPVVEILRRRYPAMPMDGLTTDERRHLTARLNKEQE